ncbi:ABC transporter ATP-binding protein [Diplocloster agilis]|uniref:ABC transporter ATP-binding protein n=1 Tax=Diplocloster agilis TaxID=2850323 RepID=UPI000822C357|nr:MULTISPECIES: ABC transporter ATP-binding protein [Lachnospiraceae]MBU9746848.1 ABC transporter ATP-binding protein/permease [Diplocloster agilis]MCU6734885.1 ABC transporter ATP-binding protein/permease [Suonthocola fibrivorans]SCJ58114.1 Lipid A export ATP-binding/permease protein MsbA [uncultured Clostridium sp.]
MFKLAGYLRNYKKESIIGPLFKLLEACFELIVPLVMASMIDIGIKNADVPYIWKMGGLLVFFGVLGLTCSLTAQYFAAKAAMGFGTELRRDMFDHINGLSYTELDKIGTSTLVTRITSDINQAQAGVNLLLRLFLRSPFIVVGAVIMAFTISVRLTVIFLVAVPLLALVIYAVMAAGIPVYRRVQNKLDRVLRMTRENLTGARVVRAFARQDDEIGDFDETTRQLQKIQLLAGKISAFENPLTYTIVNLAIIAILWFGGKQVEEGMITQGEVIALVNYMTQILLALVALANLIISATKASASAIRINEVFAVTSSMREGTKEESVHPAIEKKDDRKVTFRNVSAVYQGAKEEALSGVSFSAKAGETIGIIGGTGSGKSTLVNLIPRFYDAAAGTVLVDGIDVREYTYSALRGKVGIVPQQAVLFKGTIRENIRWGREDATDEEIYEALDIAQAREFVDAKPEGLDTRISQGGKNLSGGQRQRLTIARALAKKPEILILDDSASALDYATDAKLRKAIRTKTSGITVFLVSQRVATVRQADQILVLDDGRLVGAGTHAELLDNCPVYKEICLSQLSKEEVAGA